MTPRPPRRSARLLTALVTLSGTTFATTVAAAPKALAAPTSCTSPSTSHLWSGLVVDCPGLHLDGVIGTVSRLPCLPMNGDGQVIYWVGLGGYEPGSRLVQTEIRDTVRGGVHTFTAMAEDLQGAAPPAQHDLTPPGGLHCGDLVGLSTVSERVPTGQPLNSFEVVDGTTGGSTGWSPDDYGLWPVTDGRSAEVVVERPFNESSYGQFQLAPVDYGSPLTIKGVDVFGEGPGLGSVVPITQLPHHADTLVDDTEHGVLSSAAPDPAQPGTVDFTYRGPITTPAPGIPHSEYVLFYRADTGQYQIAHRTSTGSWPVNEDVEITVDHTSAPHVFSTGWTSILPLDNGYLFFYGDANGQYAIGHRSGSRYVNDYSSPPGTLAAGWTSVVGLDAGYLLFYDKANGQYAVGHRSGTRYINDYSSPAGALSPGFTSVLPLDNGYVAFLNRDTGQYAIGLRNGGRILTTAVAAAGALPAKWPLTTALAGGYLYLADPATDRYLVAHRVGITLVVDEQDSYPPAGGTYSQVCPLDGTWLLGYDPGGPYLITHLDTGRTSDLIQVNQGLGSGWTSITPMG